MSTFSDRIRSYAEGYAYLYRDAWMIDGVISYSEIYMTVKDGTVYEISNDGKLISTKVGLIDLLSSSKQLRLLKDYKRIPKARFYDGELKTVRKYFKLRLASLLDDKRYSNNER